MRVSKTNNEEIKSLHLLLNEIDRLSKDLHTKSLENIDFEEYESLAELEMYKDSAEDFLEQLCGIISSERSSRILINCSTLLDSCADPNLDYLDFNPEIKAGLELLERQKKEQ